MKCEGYYVYVHINKINGKKYFGITGKKRVEERWAKGKGYVNNAHFYNAIQKYGWDNFEHIILHEGLTKKRATLFERFYIATNETTNHEKGYNVTNGGDCGYSFTDESKERQSKIMKEKWKENKNFNNKTRTVICLVNDDFIETFNGTYEAARELGLDQGGVYRCCSGEVFSLTRNWGELECEFKFKFKDMEEEEYKKWISRQMTCTRSLQPVMNKETGIFYKAMAQAARKNGIDRQCIYKHCKGIYPSRKWRYATLEEYYQYYHVNFLDFYNK